MLDKIRTNINSIFSKLFLLLLAASFALWGVGDIFSPDQDPTLAEVGHLEITTNEFVTNYQRILSELSSNTNGNFTEEMALNLGLPNQTLNQLINERVYDIEVEKANLILPEKHLKKLIISSPAFKDQFGQFNQEQFKYVLRQLGMDEKKYFNEISNSILREQIRNIIQPHNDISNIIGDTYYKLRNEERAIETINFSSSSFNSNYIPSSSDIENELTNNSNKYQIPEYRSFSIMTLKPADLIDTIDINNEELINEFNNYPEKYNKAESRQVYLANFSSEEDALNILKLINKKIEEETETLLKNIFISTIVNNTDNTEDSINLGNIQYTDLPEEVAASIFNSKVNNIIGPEETLFGWRIYLVDSIEPEIIASFENVKSDIEKELKVNIALDKMYELGNLFYDELAMGNNLTDAAASINAEVNEITFINNLGKDEDNNVLENLPPYPELIETIFKTNEGETSDIINTISNIMYAVQVNQIKTKRTMSLEEAKDKIVKNLVNNDKLKLAKLNSENFFTEFKNSLNFKELANKYNLIVIQSPRIKRDGTGSEGIVNAEAIEEIFNINAAEITKPILYNDSYTISRVIEIFPAEEKTDEKIENTNTAIVNNISEDVHDIFLNTFSKNLNIKINNNLLNSLFANNN